jgi:hypothetical protein
MKMMFVHEQWYPLYKDWKRRQYRKIENKFME